MYRLACASTQSRFVRVSTKHAVALKRRTRYFQGNLPRNEFAGVQENAFRLVLFPRYYRWPNCMVLTALVYSEVTISVRRWERGLLNITRQCFGVSTFPYEESSSRGGILASLYDSLNGYEKSTLRKFCLYSERIIRNGLSRFLVYIWEKQHQRNLRKQFICVS